jgi:VCBS repeat-containing protein
VNPVNDAPVCQDVSITTDEDTAGQTDPDCADVDGDPLTYAVSLASNGTSGFSAGQITYDPDADFNGSDAFGYTANDGAVDSNQADVAVTVNPVNDAPIAADDAGATNEDANFSVAAPGVLGNDTDVDLDPITVAQANGSSANVGTEITLTSGAKVTLNANGSFTYNPNGAFESLDTGESTTDTFTYRASDGTASSNEATVTITINGVNDAPVISVATFGSSVACPSSPGVVNATLAVTFADVDDENPAFTAVVDWDNDGTIDEGPFAVSEPYFTRSHSYATVGTYTARVVVSDGSLSDSETAVVTVNYRTSGILQPVNWTQAKNDPSIFKYGTTIPVKVQFFNCDGSNAGSGLSVRIEVKKTAGSTPPSGEPENITNTNSPDSGGYMRWSDGVYIYNLNTKSLSDPTATYEITLTVGSTGQTVTTLFGTKAK